MDLILYGILKKLIDDLPKLNILNKDEDIEATSATVQTVATQYVITNYSRQPADKDMLILTLTDRPIGTDYDRVLYIYSSISSAWANTGLDVDLTNYLAVFNQTFTDEQKAIARTNVNAQETISDLSTIRSGSTAGSTAIQGVKLAGTELTPDENKKINISVDQSLSEQSTNLIANAPVAQAINQLNTRGGFLSYWNCTTGQPVTAPSPLPYTYKKGDYYLVNSNTAGSVTHSITIAGTASQYGLHEGTYSVSFTITNQTALPYSTIPAIGTALGEDGVTATGVLHTTDAGDITIIKAIEWEEEGTKVVALLDDTYQKVALTQTTADTLNDTVSGGMLNYKPDGTSYTGAASTTVETASVTSKDAYIFDGTSWVLTQNTNPDLSNYVGVFSQSFTDSQKLQARTNIKAGSINAINGSASTPALVNADLLGGTAANQFRTASAQDVIDNTKQDTISDLSTIRSGASAGATAYQKPADGIPKTDLASGVQTSLGLADSALQSHQSLSAYRTASAQDVIDAGKQNAPIIKTALDSVLVAGVQYYLGLQSSLTLTLPTTGLSAGQMVEVVFYSNTTAATLNIVGDFLGSVPTISASTKAELNFLYDGTGWSLLSLITALTTYNITATVTNATASSSNPTKMNDLYSATLTFTFDGTSYTCPTTAPTITEATGTWTKDSDTQGTLVLSAPTGAVSFTVEGVAV